MNDMSDNIAFKEWCLVELFGHQRLAGLITEQQIGGETFIRVDVPGDDDQPAFTKLFGKGAIYALTPCAEQIARKAAEVATPNPVTAFDYRIPRMLEADAGESGDDLGDDDLPY